MLAAATKRVIPHLRMSFGVNKFAFFHSLSSADEMPRLWFQADNGADYLIVLGTATLFGSLAQLRSVVWIDKAKNEKEFRTVILWKMKRRNRLDSRF